MSEFQLKPGQGYIYVGEYFHKFGKEVPSEKKIGKTDDLMSIPQIDDFAFSLDFHTPDIYLVDDVEKNEVPLNRKAFSKALQEALKNTTKQL